MSRFFIALGISSLFFSPIQVLSGYGVQDEIELSGKTYTYGELVSIIDSYLPSDILEKTESYLALISAIHYRESREENTEKKDYYRKIGEVIQLGYNSHNYILDSQVHEIVLGYSTGGREIRGYFKGNPKNGFNLITAGIHGSYEYGTYETAMMLISELESSSESGWFIIPLLNPDGLIEYEESGALLNAYLQGRDNLSGVDLNRNFCTKNFRDIEFNKYGKTLKTSNGGCESEAETKVMVKMLSEFYFKTAISLHSVGGIMYIPDGAIDDESVVALGKNILTILPEYDFYPNTSSEILRQASIKKYEIDEGDSGQFTGTFDTYIYEKLGIPAILLELESHGAIEYRLKDIFSLGI